MRDLMSALAVCNNVTPVQQGPLASLEEKDEVKLDDLNLNKRASFVGGAD
jgi:hypothetical protein